MASTIDNELQLEWGGGNRSRMTLDALERGKRATITAIDWPALDEGEGKRLRALGLDEGARIAVAHRGIFGGRDPLAIIIGRMTIALRRAHAAAITIDPA